MGSELLWTVYIKVKAGFTYLTVMAFLSSQIVSREYISGRECLPHLTPPFFHYLVLLTGSEHGDKPFPAHNLV
jgi:hypothetical protein